MNEYEHKFIYITKNLQFLNILFFSINLTQFKRLILIIKNTSIYNVSCMNKHEKIRK